jgi:hypothetical protein
MPSENYEELMSAEIDGELSEEEKALLDKHLISNPDAHRVRTQMTKLSETLDKVQQVEPPSNLGRDIMAALPPVQQPAASTVRPRFRTVRLSILKYGYVFAAGIILGLVLHQVVIKPTTNVDLSDLYGSMAPRVVGGAWQPADGMSFTSDSLTGSVQLAQLGSTVVLEFDFDSIGTVEISVRYDPQLIQFAGYNQKAAGNLSISGRNGSLSLRCEDNRQHFLLVLTDPQKIPTTFNVEFVVGGKIVDARALRTR